MSPHKIYFNIVYSGMHMVNVGHGFLIGVAYSAKTLILPNLGIYTVLKYCRTWKIVESGEKSEGVWF